ncbi:MAG TPA: hypothetical protein VNO30_08690 [Kofleriaceae bacterium]|nr:hypothetical protein [Kofleriaceae bacterium]
MVKTLLLIVALAACKSQQPQEPQKPQEPQPLQQSSQAEPKPDDQFTIEAAFAKMRGFKSDMCRCKAGDGACAEKVEQAMKDYADSMKGTKLEQIRPSKADEREMTELLMAMMKCQETARGMGPDGHRPTLQEAMAKMEGFKNDMCSCKVSDKACATKIDQALRDYAESTKGAGLEKQLTPDDEKKVTVMMTELAKCQQVIMGTGNTSAP